MSASPTPPVSKAPTRLSRDFVRLVLGLGVAVVVAVGPFLGGPLQQLVPVHHRGAAGPIAGFCTALAVVTLEFFAKEKLTAAFLRKAFLALLLLAGAAAIALMVLHIFFVVSFPIDGGAEDVPVLISTERSLACACPHDMDDLECIRMISLDRARIESCWGSRRLRLMGFLLTLSYTLVTTSFAALIVLVLLRQERERRDRIL